MALKDMWIDKIDGVDDASAEDINTIAHAVIENENNIIHAKDLSERALNTANNALSAVGDAGSLAQTALDNNAQTNLRVDAIETQIGDIETLLGGI